MRQVVRSLALALLALASCSAVNAQSDWPNKPIRIIVGSPAGGLVDVVARIVTQPITESLKQAFVVDAKPGAGGNIAADAGAKARPDGYTFFLTTVGSHGIAKSLFKKLPFDPVKDFVGVARVAEVPTVLMASNKLPARTLQEVVAYAKANPGKLNYGSTGPGTLTHLAAILFATDAGIDMVHVPQRSLADVNRSLMQGDLHLSFLHSNVSPGGHPVAVAGRERFPSLPDVPTFKEAGFNDLQVTQWLGFVAPAGTPRGIVDKFSEEVAKALKNPQVISRLAQLPAAPAMLGPKEFERFYTAEIERWAPVVQKSGASVD